MDRNSSGERFEAESLLKYDEDACSITVKGVTLRVFDEIIVRISHDSTNVQHQRINFHLVSPVIEGISVDPKNDAAAVTAMEQD